MGRSTVILGVIAAALLAFILLHERDLLSSKELEQRKNRVLTTFVRDRVSRVELVRGGQTVVLERAPDPEQEGVFGTWKQTAPMQVAVDQEAVDVLLGELEWLQPRRVLAEISAEDQQRFGLAKPRIEVRYTIGKQRHVLAVGVDEPTGIGLYARGDEPDTAYIVGKNLFEALDHDAGHFHTKELHGGIFLFAASAVVSRTAAGETRADWRDGTWWIDNPEKTILSTPEIEGVIKGLDQLRAKRFVAAKIQGPLSYGLDAPSLVLTVERKRTDAGDKALSTPVTLRVGAVCGSEAAEKYIQVNDGPVMCAADEDLQKLAKPIHELADRSPLPVDPERLVEIKLETPARTIVLRKKEERWQLTVNVAGKQTSEVAADREAVVEWLKALRALQQTGREAAAPIGSPLMAVHLKSSNTTAPVIVRVVVGAEGALFVQRAQETAWLKFEPPSLALLKPFAARFRSLVLVDDADAQLSSVTVARPDFTETAERTADHWVLKAPIVADADPIALSDVAHLLSRLSAVRFEADEPTAAHGLDANALRVTFKLGANERMLSLGNATEGGVFGQLDGETAVFVVPTRVLETVSNGLVARTALATPLERIAAVTIETEGHRYVVTKEGARFVAAGETGDSASATAAVERVARLRAENLVHYGAARATEAFERPQMTVTVGRTNEAGDTLEPYELVFGGQTGTVDAVEVFARRSDLNATFTVPLNAFQRFAELVQK